MNDRLRVVVRGQPDVDAVQGPRPGTAAGSCRQALDESPGRVGLGRFPLAGSPTKAAGRMATGRSRRFVVVPVPRVPACFAFHASQSLPFLEHSVSIAGGWMADRAAGVKDRGRAGWLFSAGGARRLP